MLDCSPLPGLRERALDHSYTACAFVTGSDKEVARTRGHAEVLSLIDLVLNTAQTAEKNETRQPRVSSLKRTAPVTVCNAQPKYSLYGDIPDLFVRKSQSADVLSGGVKQCLIGNASCSTEDGDVAIDDWLSSIAPTKRSDSRSLRLVTPKVQSVRGVIKARPGSTVTKRSVAFSAELRNSLEILNREVLGENYFQLAPESSAIPQ
mmetsp:Transcript_10886/g.29164  ORF Transcript_10886/g.29164 Transcript_10886/m.29164 type:complete len:206 (+) Transcript_10886:1063-1680(+)